MDRRIQRSLVVAAVALTVLWVAWGAYQYLWVSKGPGDFSYAAASKHFEDGRYAEALRAYNKALEENPDHLPALRGRARTLMQLQRNDEAMAAFTEAIRRAPEFAGSYANRGILEDRMGRYRDAVTDYEKALKLDPSLADGPGWVTRFLRLQTQKPPTIADRAAYLKQELAKPESERVLRVPEEDAAQRPYKP
jgi:tetratricopeptide (TPR) repeat protein